MKFLLLIFLFSCSVPRPVVQEYTVVKISGGYFEAKRGREVLSFVAQDSVWIGRVIKVSIGRK